MFFSAAASGIKREIQSDLDANYAKKTELNALSDKVNGMVQENVIAQLNNIKTHPSVAVGLRDHTLRLHGWFYDIESGEIQALDKNTKSFVSLSDNPDVFFE